MPPPPMRLKSSKPGTTGGAPVQAPGPCGIVARWKLRSSPAGSYDRVGGGSAPGSAPVVGCGTGPTTGRGASGDVEGGSVGGTAEVSPSVRPDEGSLGGL